MNTLTKLALGAMGRLRARPARKLPPKRRPPVRRTTTTSSMRK